MNRTGSTGMNTGNKDERKANSPAPQNGAPEAAAAEAPIPVDGFQQVIDMLRVADPAFRESLLRRLAVRDRKLANALREEMAAYGL